jgi:flagellin-like protein
MKGVSTVIAVILLILIVVSLATLASMFMMGVFRARLAVVLAITEVKCNATHFMIDVRNEGTDASGEVIVTITNATNAEINGTIPTIPPGRVKTVEICRATACGAPPGFSPPVIPPYYQLYRIRATTAGYIAREHVLC